MGEVEWRWWDIRVFTLIAVEVVIGWKSRSGGL
jgi:hypothetical protein